MHSIHTWDFSSTLEDMKNNKLGLAIGLGVGGSFLVGGFALI
jgi:hypothetical protein